MVNEIIKILKTTAISNVIEFGDPALPNPPYVTVKPEKHPICGTLYRLIVHMLPGQQEYLRDYIRILYPLFYRRGITNSTGNYNIILVEDDYTDITTNNDDGTISMERMLQAPSQPFGL